MAGESDNRVSFEFNLYIYICICRFEEIRDFGWAGEKGTRRDLGRHRWRFAQANSIDFSFGRKNKLTYYPKILKNLKKLKTTY